MENPGSAPGGSMSAHAMAPPGQWAVVDPLARRHNANVVWDVFLWIVLGLTALLGLFGLVTYLYGLFVPPPESVELTDDFILLLKVIQWLAIVIGFVGFGLVPVLWVQGTRQGAWAAVRPFFQLDKPLPNALLGILGGVVLAAVILGLFYVASLLGLEPPESSLEEDLGRILDWPMAVAIALQAGITEEILFRGVIQRKVGWVWQAPLFGLMHFTQGLLGFFVTGLIGLLFGYLMHRRVSMVFLMAVHFSYDMVLLGLFLSGVG